MKQFILKNKKSLTGTIAILLFGAMTMSFQDSLVPYSNFLEPDAFEVSVHCTDTVPDKEGMKMKDFDKLQTELDKTLLQLNDNLKKIDFSRFQTDMESSLKTVDIEKIMNNVELSIKNIDVDKMLAGINASLKGIDLSHTSEEMEKALTEAKKEIEKAKVELKEIDKEAIKKELEHAKKEIEKSKIEIDKIDLNKIMAEARAGIDKAKEELKLTKEMFTEMEKEGLIDSKAGFTLEYKNKELYIDGKKQSEKTTDKYRKYFKDEHFKITIDKE